MAIYDYAHYNETLLGNKSFIVTFTRRKRASLGWPVSDVVLPKFKQRFRVFEIESIRDVKRILIQFNIQLFYTLVAGVSEEVYQFENRTLWGSCKTIKHCVFEPIAPQGDMYCVISGYLNERYNTAYPVLPHLISLPESSESMRAVLGIPENATVFGGYGGVRNFDISYVHDTIYSFAKTNPHVYFIFANFKPFCAPLPNIKHLPMILDPLEKVRFINTCDAMMWARSGGEIMSIAQGEFSIKNKPIVCSKVGVGDLGHAYTLKDKAMWYHDAESLMGILTSFDRREVQTMDWNAYAEYTPEHVMGIFRSMCEILVSGGGTKTE